MGLFSKIFGKKEKQEEVVATIVEMKEVAVEESDIVTIKARRTFKSTDNKSGYVLMSSKMYPQSVQHSTKLLFATSSLTLTNGLLSRQRAKQLIWL